MTDPAEPAGIEPPGLVVEPPGDEAPAPTPAPDPGWVGLPGARSLTWEEADRVAARNGAAIVLVAGNQNSGKTTLLVQLWAQFLHGKFAGYQFAGSETLDAFDDRHYPSRVDSGNPYPETEHTTDTDMRFLHLRVANDAGERQALLMTDLWGELFLDVATGSPVASRVPVAPHAHKTMILIDGEEVADPAKREAAVRDARLLIGGFAADGGVRLHAPLLVLLSKADVLNAKAKAWYAPKVKNLIEFAKRTGYTDVDDAQVAARPLDDDPQELDAVMMWMCARPEPRPLIHPAAPATSGRVFGTGRMGAS